METQKNESNHRIKYFQIMLLVSGLLFAFACNNKKDEPKPNLTFMATLAGTNEVPPNASAATGTATLTYNQDTKVFNIVVNYSGIEATAAHIHKGAEGVAGDVAFPFAAPLTSPINYNSSPLTNQQEKDLYDTLYYVNVHSALFPAGEIRGQLVKQ